MGYRNLVFFIVLAMAFLIPPDEADGAPRPVILCLGDSLTAGYRVPRSQNFPSRLQNRLDKLALPLKVVNAGVSGDTTAGALSRLKWLLSAHPQTRIAIVTLGANDGMRGLSVTAMEHNLESIILALKGRDIQVLLGGMKLPPNYGREQTRAFQAVYPRLARRHNLPLVPFFLEGVAGEPRLNLDDGIHPTGEGYARVLENVWLPLRPLLPTTRTAVTR